MQIINDTLMEVLVGNPTLCRNLAVFPLLSGKPPRFEYLTLDEALERGLAEVAEVSESGSVPELRFTNRAEKDVLLVDGEELVGAKQNRVLNLTILVGAGHTVSIPVSCVESGRWQYKSRKFRSGGKTLYSRARARKMASVSYSMEAAAVRMSDQGEIWDDIAAKCDQMAACSPTGAMDAMYDLHAEPLRGYTEELKTVENQAGAVFVVNGKVAGLELFDNPKTFARLKDKLVQSFALDALGEAANDAPAPDVQVVREFIERLKTAKASEHLAVDLGTDVRMSGERLVGGALVLDGEVVHLAAFNLDTDAPRARGGREVMFD